MRDHETALWTSQPVAPVVDEADRSVFPLPEAPDRHHSAAHGPGTVAAMPGQERRRRLAIASHALGRLDNRDLEALLAGAAPLGHGIGGTSCRIDVEGIPVFVKRVPVTDVERRTGQVGSTSNIFSLPPSCHYGIGGPGFGVWREVAAHEMTTEWVLGGLTSAFPLTYHWRMLPSGPLALPDELQDVDQSVRYWSGSPEVRTRIGALAGASSAVWIFLEHVPYTLAGWLARQRQAGLDAIESACRLIEEEMHAGAEIMGTKKFLHLDAHFENVLTDGKRLYFADFGLAMSSDFDLSDGEIAFFRRHRNFDRSYLFTALVRWILENLAGVRRDEHLRTLERVQTSHIAEGLPEVAGRIVDRYAPIAEVALRFYRDLQVRSRDADYPTAAESRAWTKIGLAGSHT